MLENAGVPTESHGVPVTVTPPPVGTLVHERREVITASDLASAAELCAADGAQELAGAFVLALRTTIAWGLLPPGAIMLGHRATWFAPLQPAEYRTTMTIREADAPRTRYQRVVIAYLTWRDGEVIVEQTQEVLWPRS